MWKAGAKLDTLAAVVDLLARDGVETEEDLAAWLSDPSNAASLRALKGIGPKTFAYIGILLGHDAVAVDRHIRDFVARAGVSTDDCADVALVVERAAALLGVSARALDHAIWREGAKPPPH
ncbi:MAG: hypothetical protein WCK28_15800 [Burkholderiales bacterium]